MVLCSKASKGLTNCTAALAFSLMADVTPPSERSKNFGLIGIAYALALIIGQLGGGALGDVSI